MEIVAPPCLLYSTPMNRVADDHQFRSFQNPSFVSQESHKLDGSILLRDLYRDPLQQIMATILLPFLWIVQEEYIIRTKRNI